MTKDQLAQAIRQSGARTGKPMQRALEDILLRQFTWRDASIKHGVTESGILKAMRRIGVR